MIVGAGFGGLLLAVLLEQINIPYHIFERAKELRPLGSVMTMGANMLPVFEQLGLLEEVMKISNINKTVKLYNPDMSEMATQDMSFLKESLGYYSILFPRPKLYEILLSRVPANRISLNKKALSTKEEDGKVTISFSDNTTYEGDIVIGADGAHSGVRQSLYKRLDSEGLLPQTDLEAFSIGYIFMVGVSDITNPEKYPKLDDPFVQFPIVIGGDYKIWNAVITPGNQICWTLGQQLSQEEAKDQHFRNSEWGPESNESMIKEFQDKLCPLGGKMGDLIADTPKDRISKVFLEEKVFQTWYHGRTALLGDGAVSALQDSVVLANCLYEMKDASSESITSAFEKYYEQRYRHAQARFDRSHMLSKVLLGQKFIERMMRQVMFKYMPIWMLRRETVRPSVIIIGAGFGGLLLAVLLEQINIPYHIFERAKELRPLGGVMTMGANILPVFEQLGLLNEIMKISKFFKTLKLYNPDMSEMATQDILGYYSFLFSRPKLYEILLSQVPADRISLNKKALSTKEKDGKVTISFSDDTTYEGDIVVGADGAYSGVRQSLYKHLDAEGLLPKADSEAFSIGYITMVGVSDIKNPEKYPELNDPFVQFPIVISGDYKIWNAVFTPGNKICWTLGQQLSQEESKDQHFRNSEWGPESNESMIKEFQDKLCPLGGKMGDLIENTPKDRISKVFLEEKVFQTWYHGRIVLLGDAAHKLNPAGGFEIY
ncbi:hypothetical protein BGX27_000194 [Mortierella sp. AM989]|nr:hypothetical protein BGX27_000194 [Mortierella sp. AM989]